ncbi:MAG: hypothetical protein WKG00_32740 [Polyangiaceae bacterium]
MITSLPSLTTSATGRRKPPRILVPAAPTSKSVQIGSAVTPVATGGPEQPAESTTTTPANHHPRARPSITRRRVNAPDAPSQVDCSARRS